MGVESAAEVRSEEERGGEVGCEECIVLIDR